MGREIEYEGKKTNLKIEKSISKEFRKYSQENIVTRSRSASMQIPQDEQGNSITPDQFMKDHEIQITGDQVQIFLQFKQAQFPPQIQKSLDLAGFPHPSPIQASSWPYSLKGRDCLAIAKTGSGKTCGFLLPIFLNILKQEKVSGYIKSRQGPTALVMAPTRELCVQIFEEAQKFGKNAGITSCAIYGGASKGPQIGDLSRGMDIIIATPGRLLDFLKMTDYKTGQVVITLQRTSILVLDEADRMLDMGFEKDIKEIISHIKCDQKQTLFFTATWPKEVQRLANTILKNQVTIKIGNQNALSANKDIEQVIKIVKREEKYNLIKEHLTKCDPKQRVILFSNTKHNVKFFNDKLWNDGLNCAAIHGDIDQYDREFTLKQFKNGVVPILIATDVAARGLDIKGVDVINIDFPKQCEDYIHRIGRSGRAGAKGFALTFFTEEEDGKHAFELLKILKQAQQTINPQLENIARGRGQHIGSSEKKARWIQSHRGRGGRGGSYGGGRGGGYGGGHRGGFR